MIAPTCLAIDPGKLTGIALIRTEGDELILGQAWEATFADVVRTVSEVLADDPEITVVAEKFTITAQTAKNSAAPWSLEVLGAVRALMVAAGRSEDELILQTPAAAKSFCTNDNIRGMGMWHRGGKGHALDAIRHGILYYATCGFVPPRLIASKVSST